MNTKKVRTVKGYVLLDDGISTEVLLNVTRAYAEACWEHEIECYKNTVVRCTISFTPQKEGNKR